jgi:hypothetical protein
MWASNPAISDGKISLKKRKDALQSVHKDSLDYAESVRV